MYLQIYQSGLITTSIQLVLCPQVRHHYPQVKYYILEFYFHKPSIISKSWALYPQVYHHYRCMSSIIFLCLTLYPKSSIIDKFSIIYTCQALFPQCCKRSVLKYLEYIQNLMSKLITWHEFWFYRLVISSVKTTLKLEDMWRLNEEDKNSTLTAKFEKHWRQQIINSKIKL